MVTEAFFHLYRVGLTGGPCERGATLPMIFQRLETDLFAHNFRAHHSCAQRFRAGTEEIPQQAPLMEPGPVSRLLFISLRSSRSIRWVGRCCRI